MVNVLILQELIRSTTPNDREKVIINMFWYLLGSCDSKTKWEKQQLRKPQRVVKLMSDCDLMGDRFNKQVEDECRIHGWHRTYYFESLRDMNLYLNELVNVYTYIVKNPKQLTHKKVEKELLNLKKQLPSNGYGHLTVSKSVNDFLNMYTSVLTDLSVDKIIKLAKEGDKNE